MVGKGDRKPGLISCHGAPEMSSLQVCLSVLPFEAVLAAAKRAKFATRKTLFVSTDDKEHQSDIESAGAETHLLGSLEIVGDASDSPYSEVYMFRCNFVCISRKKSRMCSQRAVSPARRLMVGSDSATFSLN